MGPSVKFNEYSKELGLIFITLHHENVPYIFAVDTGSNLSILDKTVAERLPMIIDNTQNVVTGINRGKVSIGKGMQEFEIDDLTFNIEFAILDLSELIKSLEETSLTTLHGILGTDFLWKYNGLIDFENNRLRFN